jgi:hypothetical protein
MFARSLDSICFPRTRHQGKVDGTIAMTTTTTTTGVGFPQRFDVISSSRLQRLQDEDDDDDEVDVKIVRREHSLYHSRIDEQYPHTYT